MKTLNIGRWLRAIVSIGVAFSLWYSVKLVYEYTTVIRTPVRFANLPKNKKLISKLPEYLELTVTGKGHDLLAPSLSIWQDTIVVDLNNPGYNAYVRSARLANDIAAQLPASFKIVQISPDTIPLVFARKLVKRVPIESRIEVTPADGYLLSDKITFDPPFVEIVGAKQDLDKHKSWPTKPLRFTDLKQTKHTVAHLSQDSIIEVFPKKALATLPIDRFTEGQVTRRIQILHQSGENAMRVFPQTVTIKFLAPFDQIQKIKDSDFRVQLDLRKVDPNSTYLRLTADKMPPYVQNARIEPPYVRYVVNSE